MTDDLARIAAIEYRSERADDLLQQYVDQIFVCYHTDDPFDWLKAGSLFKRYKAAAIAAAQPQVVHVENDRPEMGGGLH